MLLNSEQSRYIDKLKADGVEITESSLRDSLVGAGWPEDEITEAVRRFGFSSVKATPSNNLSSDGIIENNPVRVNEEGGLPSSPVNNKVMSKTAIVVVGGLLLAVAVGAAGYFLYTKVLAPGSLTDETMLRTVYEKLSRIDTTNYDLKFSLGVVPRDEEAKAFGDMNPVSEEELAMYQRDSDRIRDITKIKNKLTEIKSPYQHSFDYSTPTTSATPKLYPLNLAGLGLVVADTQGREYKYTSLDGGQDFSLEVTFETAEAFNAMQTSRYYDEDYSSGNGLTSNRTVILKSNDYVSGYGFSGKPSQPKLFGFFSLEEIEEIIPADISAAAFFGGSIDNQADKPANARLHMGGELSLADFSVAFEAEGVKKGDTYYGILNKIPTFFGSFSQLRGKWVRLTETDLRNHGYGDFYDYYVPSDENERKREMEKAKVLLGKVLQIAVNQQVVKISSGPVKEEINGVKATKYALRLEQENLVTFVKAVIKEIEGTDYEIGESERIELIELLNSQDFKKAFEHLRENVTFHIWFDKKGYPIKFEHQVRYVPSEAARALKGKQIALTLTLDLSGINESLVIVEPKESISFDNLMVEITGQTLEEISLGRQESNISAIRGALRSYYDWTGVYPVELIQLTKKRSEVIRQEVVTKDTSQDYRYISYGDQHSDYLKEIPFIKTLPDDVFTKEAYRYNLGTADYEIIYQINLVPYTKDKNLSNYYTYAEKEVVPGEIDVTYYSTYYEETPASRNLLVPKYASGENRANKTSVSQARRVMTDSDGDSLSDALEKILGTNVSNSDTDKDGYSDYEEVTTFSNPLGPGKLDYENSSSFFF